MNLKRKGLQIVGKI